MTGFCSEGFVYFVKPEPCLSGIKIGFSKNPEKRLAKIQEEAIVRVRLIGAVKASFQDEKLLHKVLRPYRMYGEWFQTNEPVNGLVQEILRFGHMPSRRALSKMIDTGNLRTPFSTDDPPTKRRNGAKS